MPKPDLCLFCDCSPCECNTQKKTSPRPRIKKEASPAETPVVQARPSALETVRKASMRPPPISTAPARPQVTHRQSDGEKELITALQVVTTLLGGIFLNEEDRTKYQAALKEDLSVDLRAHRWRTRREASRGAG